MALHIEDIEIFSEVEESRRNQIEALFIAESYSKGDMLTEFGEPVDGLYMLEKGEVEVTIPGFEGVLATLGEGMSFGEMSLFKPDEVASATVTVSSDTAELLFCQRDVLMLALDVDEILAKGFYRGSTLLVTDRLKKTNEKISGEITESIKMATSLVQDISMEGDLGIAQEDLQSAGSVIITSMTELLRDLMVMKETNTSVTADDIAELADRAKEIYADFQVFERVDKKLKLLGQHLDNVNRILSNQDVVDVEDDMSLHDLS